MQTPHCLHSLGGTLAIAAGLYISNTNIIIIGAAMMIIAELEEIRYLIKRG